MPLKTLGIFSDDWNHVTGMAWRPPGSLVAYCLELAELARRPALALPLALQGLALRTMGLSGAFGLTWALMSLNAYLLYGLSRRQLSRPMAWLVAAVFLLHAADTTHLCLVTCNLRFAMLVALLAIGAFCNGRSWWAATLALLALQIYEISPFLLVLAPWFSSGGKRRDVHRAALVLSSIVALGALLRLCWSLVGTDTRAASAGAHFAGKASVESYLLSFPEALLLAVVKWPTRALLRSLEAEWLGWLVVSLVAAAFGLWQLGLSSAWGETARLSWRSRSSRTSHALLLRCDRTTLQLGRAAAWGAAGTMAGAALSFAAAPNFQWAHGSRINYFVTPGAALLVVALLALVARLSRTGQYLAFGLAAALLAAFFTFRLSIGRDYRSAAVEQKASLRKMLGQLPSVPSSAVVILLNRAPLAPRRAVMPFTPDADWEVRGLVRALYGYGPKAVGAWSAAELEEVRATLAGSALSRPVAIYDLGSAEVKWMNALAAPGSGQEPATRGLLEYLQSGP